MKYKLQNVCTKNFPRIVTAMAVAGSISLVGANEVHGENLEDSINQNIEDLNTLDIVDSTVNYLDNTNDNAINQVRSLNGWIKDDGKWYWLTESGRMASNEWIKDNGKWYWLTESGRMASNEWIKDNGSWYWLSESGRMYDNEWLKDKGEWYWLESGGKMAENEILKINNVWYRFDASGKMDENTNFKVGKIKECDYLNIRTGPSISYTSIGKVYTNDYVEILDSSGGWNKIKSGNGTIGWASSSYIKTIYNGGLSNGSSANETTSESANSKKIEAIIALAKKQLGKPYEWGAEGPNTFDCSGLTYYLYKQHGITLPRTSRTQATAGYEVSKSNLKPGDLVFFNTNGSGISHVGIYIGDGNMIHSTKPGDVVKTTNINSSYYASRYVTARRIID